MATTDYYFNSAHATGAPAGTLENPYKTLDAAGTAITASAPGSGNKYRFWLAAGSDFSPNILARMNAADLPGDIEWGMYIDATTPSIAEPIIRQFAPVSRTWEEVRATGASSLDSEPPVKTVEGGSNVWRPTAGTHIGLFPDGNWRRFSKGRGTATGSDQDYPDSTYRYTPITDGIGGSAVYATSTPETFYGGAFYSLIYSGGGSNSDRFIHYDRPTGNITIKNIRFLYCDDPIYINSGTGIKGEIVIQYCIFENCYCGPQIRGSESYTSVGGFSYMDISYNRLINICSNGIWLGGHVVMNGGSRVAYNILRGTNVGSSAGGGIYIRGRTSDGTRMVVEWNHVDKVDNGASKDWPADGIGIYSEENSRDIIIRYNLITRCHRGIMVNTHQGNSQIYGNFFDLAGYTSYRGNLQAEAVWINDAGYDIDDIETLTSIWWPEVDKGQGVNIMRGTEVFLNVCQGYAGLVRDTMWSSATLPQVCALVVDNIAVSNGVTGSDKLGCAVRVFGSHGSTTNPFRRHSVSGNCFRSFVDSFGEGNGADFDHDAYVENSRNSYDPTAWLAANVPTFGTGQDIDPADPDFNTTNYALTWVKPWRWVSGAPAILV